MLNKIWLGMLVLALISAIATNHVPDLAQSITDSATFAFKIAMGLVGVMAFWLGLMEIAQKAGLVKAFARWLRPLLARIFPSVAADDPALDAIVLNMSANILGLANAATPFGIRAMEHLENINPTPGIASDAMCMFLTINTSSVQLIPVTGIAFLATGGAMTPHDIILPTLLATTVSTVMGVLMARWFETWKVFAIEAQGDR